MLPSSLDELKLLAKVPCHRWLSGLLRLLAILSCAVSLLLLWTELQDGCEPVLTLLDSATSTAVCRYEKGVRALLPRLSCAQSAGWSGSRPFAFFGSVALCAQPEAELMIEQPLSSSNMTAPLGLSLSLPINATALQALLSRSRASVIGFGDQELFDPALRRSRELLPSQLRLSAGFNATLGRLKAQLWSRMVTEADKKQTLQDWRGFESPHQWRLQLHKLVVYSRGDRFVSHRDSYKAEGHVATVVALLPTTEQLSFQGGSLRISRTGWLGLSKQLTWDADNRRNSAVRANASSSSDAACGDGESSDAVSVSWAAFYCDCQHEVEEVTSGHRVALLLNLIRHTPALRRLSSPSAFSSPDDRPGES